MVATGSKLLVGLSILLSVPAVSQSAGPAAEPPCYRYVPGDDVSGLRARYDARRLGLLEKLNRRDTRHLAALDSLIEPCSWFGDELDHSPLPASYAWADEIPKAVIVHKEWQVFGAYEHGRLVRWGPISSGRRTMRTPVGLYHLNWRSKGRRSTVDPDWYLTWYFNFENFKGLSFHQYSLPGRPASHACVRLLERDARWLYAWGESWKLDSSGRTILREGTPVLVIEPYDFEAPPPWQSLEGLRTRIELPEDPLRS